MTFTIGDIVYEVYSPSKVGRIVQIDDVPLIDCYGNAVIDPATGQPRMSGLPRYTVQRLNGTTFVARSVKSFEALVADHERKAAKFRTILNQF